MDDLLDSANSALRPSFLLTALMRERDLGTLVEPSRMTVDEYLNEWLKTAAKPRVRLRTYQGYEDLLDRYIRPELGPRSLSKLTPLEIQAVYARLRERRLSAKTIRHAHSVLRCALNQAVKWCMLVINPATAVDLPKVRKKEMRCLSPKDAQEFLKKAADDRLSAMFAVAITTGMRPGEYMGLKWPDVVDLEKGVVVVQRTLVADKGGKSYFAEPTG